MTPIIALKTPAVEIAHILQKHIEDYKRQYRHGTGTSKNRLKPVKLPHR